jgi:ketosteroid isomerase-like protein
MKYISILILGFMSLLFSTSMYAQSKQQIQVKTAVEKLTSAMISGEREALEMIVSKHLSYGHSGGHVEGKAEFVEKIATGKSDFVTIDITEQSIDVLGKTAIVRHILNATTNDSGKPGVVKLKILLIFKKEQGRWKMLARQAVKA